MQEMDGLIILESFSLRARVPACLSKWHARLQLQPDPFYKNFCLLVSGQSCQNWDELILSKVLAADSGL